MIHRYRVRFSFVVRITFVVFGDLYKSNFIPYVLFIDDGGENQIGKVVEI